MTMTDLAFKNSEYLSRLEKTRQEMTRKGVELLLVTHPANIVYLCGYAAGSAYTAQALLVGSEPEEPVLITRAMDSYSGFRTAFLEKSNIIGYPESYIGMSDLDGYDFIIDHLLKHGLGNKRIGVEMGSGNFSAATWMKCSQRLPDAKFVDATGLVTWIRIVKSAAEIAYIRQAAEMSDLAMKAVVDIIAPGVRQRDAGATLIAALARGNDKYGSDRANHPNMPAGKLINAPHLGWTDGVYAPGETVNIELAGSRKRYAAALSRSVCVGKPSSAMLDIHETVLEGMNKALELAKPGNQCGSLWDAFSAVVSRKGYTKTSRIGYSIGIDWLEATASLQHGDATPLVANMTLHMICGMWEESHIGYVLSNVVLITENGHELIQDTPRKLFVKQ